MILVILSSLIPPEKPILNLKSKIRHVKRKVYFSISLQGQHNAICICTPLVFFFLPTIASFTLVLIHSYMGEGNTFTWIELWARKFQEDVCTGLLAKESPLRRTFHLQYILIIKARNGDDTKCWNWCSTDFRMWLQFVILVINITELMLHIKKYNKQ